MSVAHSVPKVATHLVVPPARRLEVLSGHVWELGVVAELGIFVAVLDAGGCCVRPGLLLAYARPGSGEPPLLTGATECGDGHRCAEER